ncbi:uncharacterized protein LOC116291723 [Actinia tenebrosa]|uniref:Uncharacterized protein LOC116291723 n=1 Tax=Actinia tenebrosa TaxID=6105 RepID=A0A6P8HG41_ACTTE|nr:uncharacterized protein LOC116291723 [Actinia tenebrosa]
MDQWRRSCFEDEKDDQDTISSKFDLEGDDSFPSINNDHRPALEDEKSSSIEKRNLLKSSEKNVNSNDEERTSESTEESLITLNSLEPELDENSKETEENDVGEKKLETKNEDEDEDEGTYEELICLVRQFYVEKPINPAALAHQNIETC